MDEKTFYLTTPIYYVNDEPHIGHAYTTILGDVITRFHRIFGYDVFYLTGLDEHGQKVQQAAQKRNKDPQEHCDEMAQRFIGLWKKLRIEYDDFIRTTQERHIKVVKKLLQACWDNGDIYEGDYVGWYCVPDERYFTEKDLGPEKNCPLCNRPTQQLTEKNYFFRMSKYQDWLKNHIHKNPDFIQPEVRRNEILGFLEKPLEDLCISRSKERLSWGIPLPFDENYVCYVWIDALINYVSAVDATVDEVKFKKWWPANYHLIGKDILTTHCVYWPTFLHSVGIEPPRTIFAHGWWLVEEAKMSKSLGNVIKPIDLVDKYGLDAFRYFLIKVMTLGQDSNFNEELFVKTINSDLANDLGNLLSRLHKMIFSYFDDTIPEPSEPAEKDNQLKSLTCETTEKVRAMIEKLKLNYALEEVLQLVRAVNKYIVEQEPWDLYKRKENKKLGTVLYFATESLRIVACLLKPVMPVKMASLLNQIGILESELKTIERNFRWGGLKPHSKLGKGEILFPRVEFKVEQETSSSQEVDETPSPKIEGEMEGVITIEDFSKIDLRTAEVLTARRVKGTDKLVHLKIKVGGEERELVAGIAQFYEPEKLIGKRIVIVANLKPVKLKGILSQGMLLAAKSGSKMTLLTVDDPTFPSGASIS